MKRTIKSILGFAVIAIVLSSCGAENDILGQFSKRKYLKKSKATKQYELANVEETTMQESIIAAKTNLSPEVIVEKQELKSEILKEEKVMQSAPKAPILSTKVNKDWILFNRNAVPNPVLEIEEPKIIVEKIRAKKGYSKSSSQVHAVVLVILCVFVITAPLAVYLYEDSITANFWLDLVLLITLVGAAIYGLLVCFADVSIA